MISVIIPVYNQKQKILEKCLKSIARQTFDNFEVIVVDDGSAAPHCVRAEILNPKSEIRNFRIFRQEHRGANAARNRGFEESRGDFILFCDSDVEMREDMIERMFQALKNHSEASYSYSSFKYGWKKFKLWPFDTEKLKKMPYIHTTSLIRREHFPGFSAQGGPASGWDEEIKRLQDWDLFLIMLENGHKGIWIPEFLFKVHSGGLMSRWIPTFLYKFSWLPWVKKYDEAVEIVKKKHNLG